MTRYDRSKFSVCLRYIYILMIAVPFVMAAPLSAVSASTEQLIIFTQAAPTAVAKKFATVQMSQIQSIAESMGISVQLKSVSDGAPEAVTITPMIVFQNHRGRSIYQGRTNTPERIRNFIRTARVVPQKDLPNQRENIPVWEIGRARIWAPLKVSGLTGTPPKDYDNQLFIQTALHDIAQGFKHFKLRDAAELGRGDRGFYMDFYPWLAEDGTLFLSLALYSQFHCKAPIFKTNDKPLVGLWKNRRKIFRQAAELMEAQVEAHFRDSNGGDGFDPVSQKTATVSWEEIGLALPKPPQKNRRDVATDLKIPTRWKVAAPSPADTPLILFHFPAPLDLYRGEVTAAKGQLEIADDLTLRGARGHIEVDTRTAVTMGDPILNEAIRGSLMLSSKKFPTARFEITSIGSENRPLSFGQLTPAALTGNFTLKGKTITLTVPAEVEPIVADDGRPLLLMHSAFRIDLNQFDIQGADGPEPANHTLLFDVNVALQEK